MKNTLRFGLPVVIGVAVTVALLFVVVPDSTEASDPVAESCSSDRFPVNVASPLSCCQDGNRTWHTNDRRALVYRDYGPVCAEADGVGTNCGVGSDPFVPCAYGPCGGRNNWVIVAEEVRVFVPLSKPDKCGWEARNVVSCRVPGPGECGGPTGGIRSYPEPYTDQQLYGGTVATCIFNRCLAGGIPAM